MYHKNLSFVCKNPLHTFKLNFRLYKPIHQLLALVFFVFMASSVFATPKTDAIKYIPIQDKGRIKPFDSFARETLQLVYGRQKFQKKPAYDVVFTWYLIPDHWGKVELIQVSHAGLRKAMKLDEKRTLFTPDELSMNDRMRLFFQELASKRSAGEKLSGYYQAVQRLESQMSAIQAIRMGYGFPMVPQKDPEARWQSVAELDKESESYKLFFNLTQAYVQTISKKEGLSGNIEKAVNEFISWHEKNVRAPYYDHKKLNAEESYNNLDPFTLSWIFYLLGGVSLLLFLLFKKSLVYKIALGFILLGFGLHSYGFGIRVYLAGRPPVANMYETLLWVPWGTILFAMILEKLKRTNILLLVSAFASALCMIITSLAPNIFDPSLQPLVPVLKSSFWLTTHVLVITISYGAFFLAWGIGNIMLGVYLKGESAHEAFLKEAAQSIYRCVQIGVVLLAAGIILGGIWADYSWGRFWGWDPKETWAFIALMGYLALLHGRLAGWFREFSMAVGAILSFSLVIMAWYGVNYVLGAGLHSYGFGVGGVEYVAFVLFLQFLYVAIVAVKRTR